MRDVSTATCSPRRAVRGCSDVIDGCRRLAAETRPAELTTLTAELVGQILGAERGVVVGVDGAPALYQQLAEVVGGSERLVSLPRSVCVALAESGGIAPAVAVAGAIGPGGCHGFVVGASSSDRLDPVGIAKLEQLLPSVGIAFDQAQTYTMLEDLVQHEMTRVVRSEESIRLILDSMTDGLVVCDASGVLTGVRSASVTRWLGDALADIRLADYLYPHDAAGAELFALSLEQLVDGCLPAELVIAQMPPRLSRDARTFAMRYATGQAGDGELVIVVTLTDITEQLAREAAEAEQRELAAVIGSLLRDRSSFGPFLDDMARLFGELREGADAATERRALHTLKGNAAMRGFGRFATRCHHLEQTLADDARSARGEEIDSLRHAWDQGLARLEQFLGTDTDGAIVVSAEEHGSLLHELERVGVMEPTLEVLRSWRQPTVGTLLRPALERAASVAENLGKEVVVSIHGDDIRLPCDDYRAFVSSLVHVVRNAVDHGIETPDARVAAGKPRRGTLEVTVEGRGENFCVTVYDDGAGIPWAELAELAQRRGVGATSRAALTQWLLSDGVSTKCETTELSGRGVGMSAVAEAWRRVGGRIDVESERGAFTRWQFRRAAGTAP